MTDNNNSQNSKTTLADHGIYMLTGEINTTSVDGAIKFILEHNLNPDCDLEYLTLIINSEGGYTADGFALIDVILGSRIPVHTLGLGLIASMGLLLFMSGEKGHRTITPNTMILSHQFSGGAFGKEHELVATQACFDLLSDNILRHYLRTTGLEEEVIRKKLLPPHDLWLTSNEAKKLGVCDIVKDVMPNHFTPGLSAKKKTRKK